jgi:hypothetical protein
VFGGAAGLASSGSDAAVMLARVLLAMSVGLILCLCILTLSSLHRRRASPDADAAVGASKTAEVNLDAP